jgi:tetratricopeptide (TPR) repeat protein
MFAELIFAALCLAIVLLILDIFLRLRARRARANPKPEPLAAAPTTPSPTPSNWAQEPAPNDESSMPEASSEKVSTAAEPTFSNVDLLQEAQLYLEYGRPAQAITILRWCLDLDPDNPRYLELLLQAYAALADWATYSALLTEHWQQSPHHFERISWVAEKVQAALAKVPDHLELRALWQELQGASGASVQSPTATPSTLIQSLPTDGSDRAKAALRVARAAVEQNPLSLSLYMDWLRIAHRAKDVESYVDALLLMTLVLGDRDPPLVERMRQTGMQLGTHPLWAQLAEPLSNQRQLRILAQARGLQLPPELDQPRRPR